MNKNNKDKIYPDKPNLILCEGFDAWRFLCDLLTVFHKQDPVFSTFCVYNFGGITDLSNYLRTLIKGTDEFKNIVKSICIIRDAEIDANSANESIKSSFKNCGFAVPIKPCLWARSNSKFSDIATGFALFPNLDESLTNGALEDLCLEILTKTNASDILAHADTAIERCKDELPRLHKNRLHAYFSLTDKFVSLKIGEASKCGAFNYDAPKFNSLKTFLLAKP